MLIRDCRWLVALAEFGHVTDTAAVLGVSQPTLSRGLARMEAELGVRLFERQPSGVVLTPDGEVALAAARDLVARFDALAAELAARHDPEKGVVRFAFLDSLGSSLVPQLLGDFHREAPGIRVLLRQEPGHEITDDLVRGAVELAVTSTRPAGEFGWHELHRERLVAIVPPSHRLRHRRRVELSELALDGLITTPTGFAYREMVDALLAEAGVVLPIAFESADLATIEGLVAAGLGVGIVPEQFAGHSGSVGLRLGSGLARRTIGLTWRADRALAAPAQRMLEFIVT